MLHLDDAGVAIQVIVDNRRTEATLLELYELSLLEGGEGDGRVARGEKLLPGDNER